MKPKPKMTYEEHVQFGRMLKDIRLMLFKACNEGGVSSREARAAQSMEKKLNQVQSIFEGPLFRNYPDKANFEVYYGQ
jgi:hypothetical protein